MREAFPIGNGYMGAMVFGGVENEHIQFNEQSLWTGDPGETDKYNGCKFVRLLLQVHYVSSSSEGYKRKIGFI